MFLDSDGGVGRRMLCSPFCVPDYPMANLGREDLISTPRRMSTYWIAFCCGFKEKSGRASALGGERPFAERDRSKVSSVIRHSNDRTCVLVDFTRIPARTSVYGGLEPLVASGSNYCRVSVGIEGGKRRKLVGLGGAWADKCIDVSIRLMMPRTIAYFEI